MINSPSSKGRFWLRLSGLLLGLAILIWLSIEDQSELLVLVFSGAICIWIASRLLLNPPQSDQQLILRHGIVGIGAGLLLAPLAVLLMAIKSGIHGHSNPEFSAAQIQSVILRTPYFILSGFLIALGIGIWRLVKRSGIEAEDND